MAKGGKCPKSQACDDVSQLENNMDDDKPKTIPKACSHEGCTRNAVKRGACHRHGFDLCSNEGCENQAVKGRKCMSCGSKLKTEPNPFGGKFRPLKRS